MKKINVAIIGQGRSGRDIHCAALTHMTDKYNIVAIVDALESRRERAKKEFACDIYANYKELFNKSDDIDFVINASFSHQHYEITKDLLENGFNVVCEKPFAKTKKEVEDLILTAKKSDKTLAVFQQSRFAPYFTKVKEIMNSGVLGRIIQINIAFNGFARRWDWQCIQDMNAGSLYNTGPHPVDQALRLLDVDEMPDIKCFMNRVNTFGDAEDYVKILFSAKDKPVIDLEISSCDGYSDYVYKVQGEFGSLKGTMEEINYKYFKNEEAPNQTLVKTPLMQEDGTPAYCGEKLTWYEEKWIVPESQANLFKTITSAYYNHLYDNYINGTEFPIKLEQIKQQIAVIEECHRQNPLNKFVTL